MKKLAAAGLALGIAFSAVSSVSAGAKWDDIGAVKVNSQYVYTEEVNSIAKEFRGVKPPQWAFNKPSVDSKDKKAIKEYIEHRMKELGGRALKYEYVKEMSIGIDGYLWVTQGIDIRSLDEEFLNRKGEFDYKDYSVTRDCTYLAELKNYAKALGNDSLYQYLNQTLYMYELAKKQNDYRFYSIGKKRLVVLNAALGN